MSFNTGDIKSLNKNRNYQKITHYELKSHRETLGLLIGLKELNDYKGERNDIGCKMQHLHQILKEPNTCMSLRILLKGD